MATRRPTNIRSGSKSETIIGMKELEAKLSDLIDATIAPEAVNEIRDAATILYKQVVANAKSVKVPHEVLEDIFISGKQPSSQGIYGASSERKQVSALVGLRKRGRGFSSGQGAKGYVEWTPKSQVGKFDKTQRSKTRGRGTVLVLPGTKSAKGDGSLQKIGENLGTMWELGTTKMQAKPWFRPAVISTRNEVISRVTEGYKRLIEKKANQK
jgi:hypothetical protein